MREAFKRCMRYLYPGGTDLEPPVETAQFCDLVHSFAMGWCEALMMAEQKQHVEDFVTVYTPMAVPGWVPDDSWKWW